MIKIINEDFSASCRYIDDDGYVSIENVANFVTDAYDGELDDRYSCIASIIHDYKDEGKVSTDVIDQYAGGHGLIDQVSKSMQ